MAKQLLNLRHVPDDESAEVRALLDEHGIAFYETPPNRWGITMGAIWIKHDAEYPRAKALMAEYQQRRYETARADYQRRKQTGDLESFADVVRKNPLRVAAYTVLIVAIVVLMLWPFWSL